MKKGREPPEPAQHRRPEPEVQLVGGIANAGHVVRVGDTVRRPQRSWSGATHALLRHLEAVGFEGAPRFLGADSQGREVLSYIPGTAVVEPYPDWALTDEALVSVAELLRAYHDAASTFDASPHSWPPSPPEGFVGDIVTHNDINLDNVVFRDGRAVALIDFDLAGPAPEPGTSPARRGCGPPSGPTSISPTGGAGAHSNGSVYSWTATA
jgi:hypothetical protein